MADEITDQDVSQEKLEALYESGSYERLLALSKAEVSKRVEVACKSCKATHRYTVKLPNTRVAADVNKYLLDHEIGRSAPKKAEASSEERNVYYMATLYGDEADQVHDLVVALHSFVEDEGGYLPDAVKSAADSLVNYVGSSDGEQQQTVGRQHFNPTGDIYRGPTDG